MKDKWIKKLCKNSIPLKWYQKFTKSKKGLFFFWGAKDNLCHCEGGSWDGEWLPVAIWYLLKGRKVFRIPCPGWVAMETVESAVAVG